VGRRGRRTIIVGEPLPPRDVGEHPSEFFLLTITSNVRQMFPIAEIR
jgi:hypothetical protein